MASNDQRTDRRTDRQTETDQPTSSNRVGIYSEEWWEVDNMFPSTGLVCDDVNSGGVAAIEDPLAQTIRCHRVLQPLHRNTPTLARGISKTGLG